jgi:hypothetical protein
MSETTARHAMYQAVRSAVHETKDVQLRSDQRDGLDAVARRLERARPRATGKRITANTLIRVGIDVVLEHADALAGYDEAELLAALRRVLHGDDDPVEGAGSD